MEIESIQNIFNFNGYKLIETALNYVDKHNEEGRLFFFADIKNLKNGAKEDEQICKEFSAMVEGIKLKKLRLSDKENVGLFRATYDWLENEYEEFKVTQQIKFDGLEESVFLMENWYKGNDTYYFVKKNKAILQKFLCEEQMVLMARAIVQLDEPDEDIKKQIIKNYEGAWSYACSQDFRSCLERLIPNECKDAKLWQVYKNIDHLILNPELMHKSQELMNLMRKKITLK